MTMHTMIDLEALSLDIDCVILSIGACTFDIDSGEIKETFYEEVDIQSQIYNQRKISESTILWWMGQSEDAKKVFNAKDKLPLGNVIDNLKYFISKDSQIWSHGASFDIPIIERLMPGHFMFHNIRDTRTLYWLADYGTPMRSSTAHNALSDALFQAKCVCKAYKILKQK